MRTITLLLSAVLAVGLLGCGEDEKGSGGSGTGGGEVPDAPAPHAPREFRYQPNGGILAPLDYLSAVVRSKRFGTTARSVSQLKGIGTAITMHQTMEGDWPESLAALAAAGTIPEAMLRSPHYMQVQIVYLRPKASRPPSDYVLAFDPVPGRRNRYAVLRPGSAVTETTYDQLVAELKAMEGKYHPPKAE